MIRRAFKEIGGWYAVLSLSLYFGSVLFAAPKKSDIQRITGPQKDIEIARLEKRVKSLKSDLKAVPRDRDRKKRLAEINSGIKSAQARIERLETGDELAIPELDLFSPAINDFGTISSSNKSFRVLDVISETEFVAELHYVHEQAVVKSIRGNQYPAIERTPKILRTPFLIRGEPTENISEDAMTTLVGTYCFSEKANWGGRKVFVVEKFNPQDVLNPKRGK